MQHTVYRNGYRSVDRVVTLDGLSILYYAYDGEDFKGMYKTMIQAIEATL
jgi:hypothetical protein